MSGPSGEIMESTHRGTILFPCGDLTIKFRDALVVPKLERNLLSLSRMLDSNPDLFVVFNKDRFEGFKGQLHGVGTTLFQSSNLFALLSNVDETKAIVSAEAEPVADVQVNDCVLNTVRKKNFVEDFASSDFLHVRARAAAPILDTMDGTQSQLSKEPLPTKIASADRPTEAESCRKAICTCWHRLWIGPGSRCL